MWFISINSALTYQPIGDGQSSVGDQLAHQVLEPRVLFHQLGRQLAALRSRVQPRAVVDVRAVTAAW